MVWLVAVRQAEVDEGRPPRTVLSKDHVGRPHVVVQNAVRMRRMKGTHEVQANCQHRGDGKRDTLDETLRERDPRHIAPHDQEEPAVMADFERRGDARQYQPAEHLYVVLEPELRAGRDAPGWSTLDDDRLAASQIDTQERFDEGAAVQDGRRAVTSEAEVNSSGRNLRVRHTMSVGAKSRLGHGRIGSRSPSRPRNDKVDLSSPLDNACDLGVSRPRSPGLPV